MEERIVNSVIDHLKKSPILQEAVAAADSIMDYLNKSLTHDPIPLDVLVGKLSASTDQIIIASEQAENIEFIGGELTAQLPPLDEKTFALKLKLYFKNKQGEIVLKESEKRLNLNILTNESIQELKEQEQTFEVNEPASQSKNDFV